MKYYAVARGIQPGIYTTWDAAKSQVNGYKGAIYKSFASKSDAQKFIDSVNPPVSSAAPVHRSDTIYVYTDGSSIRDVSGYGFVVVTPDWIDKLYGKVDPTMWGLPAKSHNDVSELVAAYQALVYIQSLNTDMPVVILTDSTYVADTFSIWIHEWKKTGKSVANSALVYAIHDLAQSLHVKFQHIDAHSGHQYNEMADSLADMGRSAEAVGPYRSHQ